jgi:hypothetical protein
VETIDIAKVKDILITVEKEIGEDEKIVGAIWGSTNVAMAVSFQISITRG